MRLTGSSTTLADALAAIGSYELLGEVRALKGPLVCLGGMERFLSVGDRVLLRPPSRPAVLAEVTGFQDGTAHALPLGPVDGLGRATSARATAAGRSRALAVSDAWLGRVVDPLGAPVDGPTPLSPGPPRATRATPPAGMERAGLGDRLDLGVRVLNAFTPCRAGQRLGLFAGSGVGKSTLLGMLARNVACDVIVVALVGERGREVRPFVEEAIGAAGMERAVVVVATSDAAPMLRREALYAATTVAEHFRDQGRSVLLLVDSLTRFCQALREIGLALEELPGRGGWPPSVFAELPRLLERAGPGRAGSGSITALYTVLVDGDDPDEPVSDAARGLLDGHIWLDRRLAERGRFPAVDVARSLSRGAAETLAPPDRSLAARARAVLAQAAEAVELLRLGVYARGADAETDQALDAGARLGAWLGQAPTEVAPFATVFAELAEQLGGGRG